MARSRFRALLAAITLMPMTASAVGTSGFLQEPNEVFYSDYYVAPNDVDGDGLSDLLWFNAQTSQFAYWISSQQDTSHFYARTSYRVFNIAPGYRVSGVGDFNADTRADLVWTSARRDLYLWTASGNGFQSSYIGTYPDGWELVGAADVNGDGDADLLWSNAGSCQFGYWLMRGAKRIGSRTMSVACGYRIAAIGHFQQSTHVDLLWTSDAHDLYLWVGTANGFRSRQIGSYGSQEHVVAAAEAGDFGGLNVYTEDGAGQFTQYVWRQYFSGDTETMDTFDVVQSFPVADGNYLAATGNFDQGNEAVLVWANDTLNASVTPSTPGSLSWYSETFSDGTGWNYTSALTSYPAGWALVGSSP
jgi:hypothetical protein